MKINILYILLFILVLIPLSAYTDTMEFGLYSFRDYLAICSWEAGIGIFGLAIGYFISEWNNKEELKSKLENKNGKSK